MKRLSKELGQHNDNCACTQPVVHVMIMVLMLYPCHLFLQRTMYCYSSVAGWRMSQVRMQCKEERDVKLQTNNSRQVGQWEGRADKGDCGENGGEGSVQPYHHWHLLSLPLVFDLQWRASTRLLQRCLARRPSDASEVTFRRKRVSSSRLSMLCHLQQPGPNIPAMICTNNIHDKHLSHVSSFTFRRPVNPQGKSYFIESCIPITSKTGREQSSPAGVCEDSCVFGKSITSSSSFWVSSSIRLMSSMVRPTHLSIQQNSWRWKLVKIRFSCCGKEDMN